MKRSELVQLVREVLQELDEANVTGGGATFTPGTGAQYATPFAFSKGNKQNRATKLLKKQAHQLWQIPVCYDVSFGIDLEEIACKKKCSVAEIIRLHTEGDYLVYFIGFQPGFLYLGGLHQNLHVPRKSNPRVRVDKGSVGIGGAQTGIYPQNSSGGWNIIGKSPLNFFNMKASNPCFAKPGDRIQFVAVDLHTFYQIEREVANQKYRIKKSVL